MLLLFYRHVYSSLTQILTLSSVANEGIVGEISLSVPNWGRNRVDGKEGVFKWDLFSLEFFVFFVG
jgi:hypothetical protein